VNFFNPREFSGFPSASAYFFYAPINHHAKRRRPRIKSRKTTQRYEFISCNPYRPSG
jgi:hypothetical protein